MLPYSGLAYGNMNKPRHWQRKRWSYPSSINSHGLRQLPGLLSVTRDRDWGAGLRELR